MNRDDLQTLTNERILDAQALLNAERWSGAYYLCGYAVECALKAIIAGQTNLHDFPDKNFATKIYTHDLWALLKAAILEAHLKHDDREGLKTNWELVKDWNEGARYLIKSEAQARNIHEAVTNDADGVLKWVKKFW